MKNNRVLIVAAHPDDEILGCAGTVARLIEEGCEAYTLILGEGITSRDGKRDRGNREKDVQALKKQITLANKVINVNEVFSYDFPDNRFDSVALLDIIKVVEKVKKDVSPQIIFTHYGQDLNIDHQVTYQAVITAIRPLSGETVKEIYSFEVLSSTEWNYPLSFSPDIFVDISDTLDLKLKAMGAYRSELQNYPHPRSLEGIRKNAEVWGMRVGLKYVEAFKVIRFIR